MTIHMVKLCVGAEDIGDLEAWQQRLMQQADRPYHHTRMIPRRGGELSDGGSIYWVIKGWIQIRQPILDVKEITDRHGKRACELIFDPKLVKVDPVPKRPFQGWRYLKPSDAPADLAGGGAVQALPANLRSELKQALVW
ncbi:MAG: DUF1489 domain-containing protein [Pseudomonadota bacterium]